MPDTLIKDQLLDKLAKLTNIDVKKISRWHLDKDKKDEPSQPRSRLSNREVRQTPIRYAISLLLTKPSLTQFIENIEQIALSELPGSNLLTTLIETIQESPQINAAALLERWRNTEFEAPLINLMKWQPETDDEDVLRRELQDCLRQIRKKATDTKVERLLHKERTSGLDKHEIQELQFLLQNRDL